MVQLNELNRWPPRSPVEAGFVLFLALDAREIADDQLAAFAARMLGQGAVYVCCGGPDCGRVHDIFDDIDIRRSRSDPPETALVITTLHPLPERPNRLTGTVRWWNDEKGYGRITGDDGYVYFCHFSALQMDGYKTLRQGQRVEFERIERMAAHGRVGAPNVVVLRDDAQV